MHPSLRFLVCFAAVSALSGCATGLRTSTPASNPGKVKVGGELGDAAADAIPANVNLADEGPVTPNDLTDSGDDMKSVPHEVNRLVLQWVDYFQGRGRHHMERYLSRSGKYLPMMKEILRKEGLPEDLVYIALIESGFSAHAHSSANAVGYWQFIRGTGTRYGLRVDSLVDERRDFEKATLAAADYLKGLYNLFGSWYLAIASYNVGEGRIMRLIMKHHTRNFWDLATKRRLPQETINYVPKYLAARMIAKEPEKYGFGAVEYHQPLSYDLVEVQHSVDLRKMAEAMNVDHEELRALNPAYKRGIAIESGGKLVLRVPKNQKDQALAAATVALVIPGRALAGIPIGGEEFTYYRVRRGDTLSSIARKFRTTTRAIRNMNKLASHGRVYAGRKIKVPGESLAGLAKREIARDTSRTKIVQAKAIASASPSKRGSRRVHVVRSGDTLIDIARRYRVSLTQLASHNQITRKSKINIGTRLEIPEQR